MEAIPATLTATRRHIRRERMSQRTQHPPILHHKREAPPTAPERTRAVTVRTRPSTYAAKVPHHQSARARHTTKQRGRSDGEMMPVKTGVAWKQEREIRQFAVDHSAIHALHQGEPTQILAHRHLQNRLVKMHCSGNRGDHQSCEDTRQRGRLAAMRLETQEQTAMNRQKGLYKLQPYYHSPKAATAPPMVVRQQIPGSES
jgi:hypothetical protein